MNAHRLDTTVVHYATCYVRTSENWIHTQVKHLHDHAPFVLTHKVQNLDRLDRIPPYYQLFGRSLPVRVFDRLGHALLGYRPAYRRQVRRRNAELLHAHFGPAGFRMLPLARAVDIPLVTTFYGYDLSRLPSDRPEWRERYRELFRDGAHFLTEGSHMREQLIELGCPSEKVSVQHLGVDTDAFALQPRHRAPDEPLRVLVAGRFVEKKGLPDAIRAFIRFVASGRDGRLTVVGDAGRRAHEQAIRDELHALVRDHDVGDRVDFAGFVPHDALVDAYYDHHVFLSPSIQAADGDNEGGAPVTLIEASATGMPIVATRHCDVPEVVRHETTGLLADERDVETLAHHLATLYDDVDRMTMLGRAAADHVDREYDAARQGRRLDALYTRLRRAAD